MEQVVTGIQKMNTRSEECVHCHQMYSPGNIKRHEKSCKENPANLKTCPVCSKTHTKKSATCGYACANTHFRSGVNHGNHKAHNYRTVCFSHWEKKCIICGEDKIVAVHHYDENHDNNHYENLVPMCPTHHQYMHSSYADELEPLVEEYMNDRRRKGSGREVL